MTDRLFICIPDLARANGGSYQFLRSLASALDRLGFLAAHPDDATALLFNSSQHVDTVCRLRRTHPRARFIHRVDGPMRLYNKPTDGRDAVVYRANALLADGTVFQSDWSRRENLRLGMPPPRIHTVIPNAPDPLVFHPGPAAPPLVARKARIMAVSWSANWNKGFAALQWLDEHLDFSRFDLTFMGNSPVAFSRIRCLPPGSSPEVAEELRRHDIFLGASAKEPCSNALIEAMSCGLPVVALRDGCYPELVGAAGEFFTRPDEIPGLLDRVVARHEAYATRLAVRSLNDIARDYVAFAQRIGPVRHAGWRRLRGATGIDHASLRWTQWRARRREEAAR
jgi:glycosyltransferase involved in cell wall biosynthesis